MSDHASDSQSSGTKITFTVTIEFPKTLDITPDVIMQQAVEALLMRTFGSTHVHAYPAHVNITPARSPGKGASA